MVGVWGIVECKNHCNPALGTVKAINWKAEREEETSNTNNSNTKANAAAAAQTGTAPWPTPATLEPLIQELRRAGIASGRVT